MTSKKTWKHFWGCFFSYLNMEELITKCQNTKSSEQLTVLMQVAENILNVSKDIYRYNLDEEERGNLNKLSMVDYWKVQQRVISWNDMQNQQEIYPFPYHLFSINSKIVLYGAGNIGKRYYLQLQKNGYAKVVKWVDKNYMEIRNELFPVDDIKLEDCDYEYILIAIANRDVAEQVIQSLMNKGVPEEKILWCGDEYFVYPKNQMGLMHNRINIYNQLCMSQTKKIFLLITPEHGNLGDYAIALAERKFFKKYFKEYPLIEVTTPQWEQQKDEYKRIVSSNDLVCISGGGYLGNMWYSGQIMKDIITAFPENQKVLFPNTLTYMDNDEKEMEKDAEFFREQKHLLIMARDKASYERLLKYHYQQDKNIHYYPDMALSLNYSEEKTNRNSICLCLRDDVEKSLSETELEEIIGFFEKQNLAFAKTNIHLNKRVPRELGEYEIQKKIDEFKQYKLVITDRLHGMIFAAISGTPCIAFDNVTHKVFGVYEWIQSLPYIKICNDIKQFERILCELVDEPLCKYDSSLLGEHFEEMSNYIREEFKC